MEENTTKRKEKRPMKFCQKCGIEMNDELLQCPECGNATTATNSVTETSEKGKAKSKKPTKKVCITVVAIILFIAIVVCCALGILTVKNKKYAQEIALMLEGKTFENVSAETKDENVDIFMAYTSKFANGQIIYDTWYYYSLATQDEKWQHSQSTSEYEVEVPLFGSPKVCGYEIIIENNQIVCLSNNSGKMTPVEIPAISKRAVAVFSDLGWTWGSTSEPFGTLIPEVFKNYTIYVDPRVGEEYCFDIEVSGEFYPDKLNRPRYTKEGSFSCKVNIKSEEATEFNIDREIGTAFNMQVAYSGLF